MANRSHRTIANDTLSDKADVKFGVPQGSALEPLLFVLFMNDLCGSLTNCTPVFYADDIVMYVSRENPNELIELMQTDVTALHNWCTENFMTVNTDESMLMYFGSKSKLSNAPVPRIRMGGKILPVTEKYCYLGVELDGPLTINPQLGKVKKTVGNKLYKLGKLRKVIGKHTSLEVYKSMIVPVMDYCSFYTGAGQQSELAKL